MTKDMITPTDALYGTFERGFNHFNKGVFEKAFGKTLRPVVFTFHRNPRALGYYHGEIFIRSHVEGAPVYQDELAINPNHIFNRTLPDIYSTLVHEMCHHYQKYFSKEPSRSYHNRDFANIMKAAGLYPSHTGAPGGRETGQHMSHYVIEGGLFDVACKELLAMEEHVFYQDRLALQKQVQKLGGDEDGGEGEGEGGESEPTKSTGRAKFVCPGCELKATAKPSANLICGDCKMTMETVE